VAIYGSLGRAYARFDDFYVDLSTDELLRSGERISVQHKPLQILRLMLEAEGRVVTREQLRSALWPEDTFVDFEHGVNTAVKKLRHALEDSAEHPRLIETIPKVGYRFLAPVEWEDGARRETPPSPVMPVSEPPHVEAHPGEPSMPSWVRKAAVAIAAATALVATVFFLRENGYLDDTRLGKLRRFVVEHRAGEPPPVRERQVTANPGDTPLTGGILSPDGKYLAYSDSSGFYLRLAETGETHAIRFQRGFDPLPESWFPDSVHMVVSWVADPIKGTPSLWVLSVLGGTPRKLAERGSSARVSPDGARIAFLAGPWDDEEIWLIQTDGSNARKVVEGGRDGFGAVAWAPDGRAFACIRTIQNQRPERAPKQIEVHDLASGRTEVIFSESRLGDQIVWTADGRLFYSLEEPEPNQVDANLWSMPIDARTRRPTGQPTKITNNRGYIGGISVAEDSKRMAILRHTTQADVYVAEIQANGKRLNAPRRLTLDERADWPNAWTADSQSVLFRSDRDGPVQIYKQNIGETQPEVLVRGTENNIYGGPRLTYDGKEALYAVGATPGEPSYTMGIKLTRLPIAGSPSQALRVMRVPISGGASQTVLEGESIANFQCATPPSTLCIYGQIKSDEPFQRLYTFDPAAGKGKEILPGKLRNDGGLNFWTLSPDGKYLVTAKPRNPGEEPALRIIRVASGAEQEIAVPEIALLIGMDWAADSKSVWIGGYLGRGSWGTRSGILNVALSGKVRVALQGLNPEIWYAIPSWDGRHLALMGRTQNSNLWLLQNF
jgi:DNA-binding winged helix-turn-helix (wHTH) protein/Tol biopolymer transport system component